MDEEDVEFEIDQLKERVDELEDEIKLLKKKIK
jgi:cell division protein FtsB